MDFVQWTGPSPTQDPANWQQIAYKQDVTGRRVEKKVDGYSTRYAYDGDHIIGEYDGNNNLLRKYIYGPGIDQPVSMIEVADSNAAYYYHFDALGSVVALSDAAGDTVQTYQYSVYGEVAVEDANYTNPYMFTGRRFDVETGLYYYRARYYNPFMGRFLQADPVGYEADMNLYRYCFNNPGNYVDPFGLDTSGTSDCNCQDEQEAYNQALEAWEDAVDALNLEAVAYWAAVLDTDATWKEYQRTNALLGVASVAIIRYCFPPRILLPGGKKKCLAAMGAAAGLLLELEVDRAAWKAAFAREKYHQLLIEQLNKKRLKAEEVFNAAKAALEACLARREGSSGSH